jgi:hypothetical protein
MGNSEQKPNMTRFRYSIGIALLLTGLGAADGGENNEPLPAIWIEIEREVRAVVQQPGSLNDLTALRRRLQERSEKIAEHYDRPAVAMLFGSVQEARKRMRNTTEDQLAAQLSALVIADLADPADEQGLKSVLTRWSVKFGNDWDLVAIAAVDIFHDESSRKLLLEVALQDATASGAKHKGRFLFDPPDRSGIAWQLLRGYEAEDLREKLQKELIAARAVAERDHPQWRSRAADLRTVMSCIDYAARVQDPAVRARYRSLQSRIWRARAFGPKGFRAVQSQYSEAAKIVQKQWRPGDEPFLIRILEDTASTPDETLIASYLVHRLPDNARKELDASGD